MGYRRRLSEWSGVLEGCSNGEIGLQVSYRPSKYVPSGICNVTLQAFRTAPSATSPQYEDGSCMAAVANRWEHVGQSTLRLLWTV